MTNLTRNAALNQHETSAGIEPRPMPTRPAQRRLWSVLAEPGTGQAFDATQAIELRLEGALDIEALHAALNELLARHDVLRARFSDDGKRMLVSPAAQIDLLIHEFENTTAAMRDMRIAEFVDEAVTQPLDPCHDLLLRASLLRVDDERHRLLLLVHRLVGDHASLTRLATELGSLYAACRGVTTEPLRPAASVLDRQPADSGAADPSPITLLPTDRPRGRRPNLSLARIEHKLTADRLMALRTLAAQHGAELQAVFAAASALWLARLTGDETVRFAWRPAGEPAVSGPLGEQQLTLQVDPAAPFTRLLDAAAAALQSEGGQASNDPAAVSIALLPDPGALGNAFPGLHAEAILLPSRCDLCEVSLEIALGRTDARLGCHYQTSLFSAATIGHWLDSFDCLLASLADTPAAAAGSLALLGDATRSALEGWQPQFRPLPDSGWIHRSVDTSRQRHPERPALQCHDGRLDYAGLAARSNRIAHALQARGVGPGARVGLCLERDLEMLPSMLAVLKCGAAYVPLDPGFPPERLDFMVRDADLALVVSNRRLLDTLRLPIAERLLLDQDRDEIDAHSDADIDLLPADADPRRTPAYVIYTSGSTGKPKGVVVPHTAVANLLHSMAERPGFTSGDRLVAVTTLSFDISVLELLLPLWVGAEVVLATREQVADGRELRRLIEGSGANTLQATPASWRLLLDAGFQPPGGFRALCGGEALPADLADRLTTDGVELWNLYGPTETTVWSTCWKVEPRTRGIAIGQPIRNTHVRVLDAHGQQCPVGVSGEICIGGDGVALGYWQRPELTADRFVPDPFMPAEPGAPPRMLYRTGDRGRWCSDGQIEHQGRFDHQVKLRGYRIELGEIEAQLTALESIARSLVIVREDRPGDQRLVAYIVPTPEHVTDTAHIRAALRRFLPEYMMPQHLVPLAKLPRLPNGKTDRAALPPPQASQDLFELGGHSLPAATTRPPQSPLQALFHNLWAEVLGHDEFGIDDSFFDLGGYSLIAVSMFHQAEQQTGVNLPLATLFRAPTIAALASAFAAAGSRISDSAEEPSTISTAEDVWRPLVPIRPAGLATPLFLVHAVGGNVMNYRALARALPTDVPVYGLQAVGLDGLTAPLTSIPAMAERYVGEIVSKQPKGPYRIGGGSMGGVVAFEIARRLRACGERVELLAMFDSEMPRWRDSKAARVPLGSLRARLRELFDGNASALLRRVSASLSSRTRALADRTRVSTYRLLRRALPHSVRYRHVERVSLRAYQAYVPGDYDGEITLFLASDGRAGRDFDPTLGWRDVVGERVRVLPVDGTHGDLISRASLAAALAAALDTGAGPRRRSIE
ncbi:non-ribosomal peptide synthetase [Wenzhouxiangella sp. EGI_FJ10305]|uniref:non-ribosomal peptide synthetase n=1 Tax=Wenzhouxiangella sp. EGI_FJ10305 TaxID=3243768 RepID=UPI0035DD12BA